MRSMTAFTLALATCTVLACDTNDTDDDLEVEPGQEVPADQTPVPVPDETMVSLSEFQPADGATTAGAVPIRGSAELRRVTDDGSLELHVRLEGLPEGDHAWHIHDAPCGQQGAIVVALSGAPGRDGIAGDLDVGSDGVVEKRTTIDAEHLRNLDLSTQRALNVHQGSGDNPGPAIACANIGGPNATMSTGTTPNTGGTPASTPPRN